MDQRDRVRFLVSRYLDNRCTREEMDELLAHMQRYPDDKDVLELLAEPWNAEATEDDSSLQPLWQDMQERIQAVPSAGTSGISRWKIAACLLPAIAFLAGWVMLQNNGALPESGKRLADLEPIATTKNEHRLVVLSDGSRVWINGDSRLVSPGEFSANVREVTLSGEAFFDIARDVNRPFIITTGSVKTTVLGTAFNIRAFPEEGEVTVTVARGKVKVEAGNTLGRVIGANEQVTLDVPADQLQSGPVDATEATRWTEEDLVLYEITLDEVEEILEERYGVDIRLDKAMLRTCRFTTTLYKQATLDEILTSICLVNAASYERTGEKVVTIYGPGCPEGSTGN